MRDFLFTDPRRRWLRRSVNEQTPLTQDTLPELRAIDRECVQTLLWTLYTGCNVDSAARVLAPHMRARPAAVRAALSQRLRDDLHHTCRTAISSGLIDAMISGTTLDSPVWRSHAAIFAARSSMWANVLRVGGAFPPRVAAPRSVVHQLVALVYTGTLDTAVAMPYEQVLETAAMANEYGVNGASLGIFGCVAPHVDEARTLELLAAVRTSHPREAARLADELVGIVSWPNIAGIVSGAGMVANAREGTLGDEYVSRFSEITGSAAWKAEVQRASDTGDTRLLERICSAVLGRINTENVAAIYYQLLDDAILCDDGRLPTGAALDTLNACRCALLDYISRNWLRIRERKGFDCLPTWCLKELSQDLSVDADALLREPRPATAAAAAAADGGSMRGVTSAGVGNAPEDVRPAGPIHMRAAVVNRAAARAAH